MSSTSGGSYDCQLCQNTYDNKVALTVHFCKHLSYKKYPCNSCRESFYTEDDRGEHCQKANHDNMYTVKSSPYCEMLVNQLLKDAKLLTIYDMNVIVAKRAKKNFEFEHELRDCEQKVKKEQPRTPRKSSPPRKSEPSPSPRSRKNSPAPGKSRKDSAEEKTRKEPSPVKSRKEAKVKGILKRTYSETASEETNEAAATATTNETKKKRHSSQSVTETTPKRAAETPKDPILKLPNSSDVKFPCGLCNRKVPSDYVSRKDHVSRKHMTTDHSDEDYVPILEAQMKKAFVDWTHSDLDCQLCRKQYKTVSGRREHAAKSHLPERLSCPIAACPFASESSAMVNKHLKQVHDLEDGYKSLDDADERKAFEAKLRQHNQQLAEITKHCFPCLIPVFYQCSTKKTGTPKNAEPLLNVSRIFQSTPMSRPLRRQSESTDSDESTHRDDPALDHQAASPETADTETAENDMNGSESPLVFDSVDIKNVQLLQEPARGWASTTEEQSQPETTSPMEEDDDIVFVREKNKRKIKKNENIVVKEEVAEDANPIQLPAEPAYLHQQFTLPPMNLQPQAPARFTTVSPDLSDLHLQGSYTPQSSLVHQERGALSDDQRDQYASHRSQTSRSPRAFRHKDYRDQRSWSMSRSFRDRGGYRGGHCRSDERRNSENHSSYTLQRERSLPRGSNQFSYGFRLRGSGSDRYGRERQREGSERPRSSREPDRGQDDNRHYRNPSGQRPTYSILPK